MGEDRHSPGNRAGLQVMNCAALDAIQRPQVGPAFPSEHIINTSSSHKDSLYMHNNEIEK